MASDIRRVNSICFIILASVTLRITLANDYRRRYSENRPQNAYYESGIFNYNEKLSKLIILLKTRNVLLEKNREQCLRLFGSIYGNKDEKIKCLNRLKKKKIERDRLKAVILGSSKTQGSDNGPFVDLTRISNDYDEHARSAVANAPKSFSTDYIDFNDLRSTFKEKGRPVKPKRILADFRKYLESLRTRYPHNIKQRAAYDSSEDDTSSSNEQTRTKDASKKPKRFQVIGNVDYKESYGSPEVLNVGNTVSKLTEETKDASVSSDSSGSSSDETTTRKELSESEESTTRKPMTKIIIKNKHTIKLGSETDSVEYKPKLRPKLKLKYTNPLKTADYNKELYLQGNHVVDLSGRKRLETFLPKRFHWTQDDLDHLGYYWFNGPQGKYPFYPVRP